MEPLNDDELNGLLRTWKAPPAPEHLQPSFTRRPWYVALWTKSVSIPVPVLALILLALVALQVLLSRNNANTPPAAPREIRLADFEPVAEAKPVLVRRTQYEDR